MKRVAQETTVMKLLALFLLAGIGAAMGLGRAGAAGSVWTDGPQAARA
jgi:hypothetical protein